jgi:hypothetical protein
MYKKPQCLLVPCFKKKDVLGLVDCPAVEQKKRGKGGATSRVGASANYLRAV